MSSPSRGLEGRIRLNTLGTLRLERADGSSCDSVVAQPKRLALLLYLALARPRGFQSRDVLIRIFWPELDQARARAALSQALYVIRRGVGTEVIVSRGDGDVAIADDVLHFDALDLEASLDAGDHAAALQLYGGELLDGFYIPNAPEFDGWLEGERLRLRRLAAQAAARAAESAATIADAADFARRACAIDRTDESALRRLLTLLSEAGERAAAMAEYEAYRRWLAAELEVEPSPETQALAASLTVRATQAMVDGATSYAPPPPAEDDPASQAADGVQEDATSQAAAGVQDDATSPASGSAGLMRVLRAGRPRRRMALAALVLLAVVTGAWSLLSHRRLSASDVANRVAILPFAFEGNDELEYLGAGMVDLIGAKMHDVDGVRLVDPYRVIRGARDAAVSGPGRAAEVARTVGAGRFIMGRVHEAGGALRITAQVYDGSGRVIGRAEASAADEAGLFGAIDALSHQLIRDLAGPGAARLGLLASTTTPSLTALKAYLAGEHAMRLGNYPAAVREFTRATLEDSMFALAYYRKAVAADWSADGIANNEGRDGARRLADRLPSHMQQFVRAVDDFYGDFARGEASLRELSARHPDEAEIWYQLAESVIHTAPLQGRSFTEARHPLERVLALQPGHIDAAAHLLRVAVREAVREGRREEAGGLGEILRRTGQRQLALEAEALLAFGFDDPAAEAAFLKRAAAMPPELLWVISARVADVTENLQGAAQLLAQAERRTGPVEERTYSMVGRASMLASAGQWRAAAAELDRLQTTSPSALYLRAYHASMPHVPVPDAELRRIRDELAGPVPSAAGMPRPLVQSARLLAEYRHYYIGEISLRLGDVAAARRALDALANLDSIEFFPPVHVLRARIAQATGEPQEALRILEAHRRQERDRRTFTRWVFYSSVHERLLRGQLLQQVGRHDEALAWLGSVHEDLGMSYPHAPARLARAQILDGRGDVDAAIEEYRRVLVLWARADAPLQETVRQVRARVAALEAGRD